MTIQTRKNPELEKLTSDEFVIVMVKVALLDERSGEELASDLFQISIRFERIGPTTESLLEDEVLDEVDEATEDTEET